MDSWDRNRRGDNNGWFIMENPMNKWMIWGVKNPIFGRPPIWELLLLRVKLGRNGQVWTCHQKRPVDTALVLRRRGWLWTHRPLWVHADDWWLGGRPKVVQVVWGSLGCQKCETPPSNGQSPTFLTFLFFLGWGFFKGIFTSHCCWEGEYTKMCQFY